MCSGIPFLFCWHMDMHTIGDLYLLTSIRISYKLCDKKFHHKANPYLRQGKINYCWLLTHINIHFFGGKVDKKN